MGKRRRHPHGRVGARGPPPAQPTRSPGGRGLLWTRSVTSWKGSRMARPGGGAGSPVSTLSQALEGTPDLGPCAMPPPRETGAPRRSLPHGSSVCRGWASWGSVPSRVDARVGRRPLPSVWLSLAASRRCRPARCAPRSAHGRPRRRPACVCRPCGPHSVWLDLGSRGVR